MIRRKPSAHELRRQLKRGIKAILWGTPEEARAICGDLSAAAIIERVRRFQQLRRRAA